MTPTYTDAVRGEMAKHSDRDARRIVALAWIKVAVERGASDAERVADVRAVLAALEQT